MCFVPLSGIPEGLHTPGVCRPPRGDAEGGLFSLPNTAWGAVSDSTTSRVRDVRQNREWCAGHVAAGTSTPPRAFEHRERLLDHRVEASCACVGGVGSMHADVCHEFELTSELTNDRTCGASCAFEVEEWAQERRVEAR